MKRNLHKTSRGATSLAELLVGISLFMVFMTMLFFLYLYGYKSWKDADIKLSIDREAVEAMDEISRSILHSNMESVTIQFFSAIPPTGVPVGNPPSTSYCAVSMGTAYNTDGVFQVDPISGKPIWQGYLIYYINPNDKTLRKKRVELTPPPNPADPDCIVPKPLDSAQLQAQLTGDGRVIARDVKSFRTLDRALTTEQGTITPTNPMCLEIFVEKNSTKEDRPETIKLKRTLQMLN